MTSASGGRVQPAHFGTFRHLLAETRQRLGRPGLALRWSLLAVGTVGGWIAIALWLPTQHGRFDGHEQLWPLMVSCGLVGCLQAYVQLCGTERTGRDGKTRTALLRWWGVLLVIAAHVAVTFALSSLIVPPVTADARFDAAADVLFLGFFAWALGPLIVLLGVAIVIAVVAFSGAGFTDLEKASRAPRGLPRARLISNGVALLGLTVALLALIVAIPWLGIQGGGRGAALAAIVVLFLQAIGSLPASSNPWLEFDRIAYLVGLAAALQALFFTLWVNVTGRSTAVQASDPADA